MKTTTQDVKMSEVIYGFQLESDLESGLAEKLSGSISWCGIIGFVSSFVFGRASMGTLSADNMIIFRKRRRLLSFPLQLTRESREGCYQKFGSVCIVRSTMFFSYAVIAVIA